MNLQNRSENIKKIVNEESESVISAESSNSTANQNNEVDADALTTISQNTARTELTHFTSCTNPTFDPVHREWKFEFYFF